MYTAIKEVLIIIITLICTSFASEELNDVSEVGREKAADYTPQIISEGRVIETREGESVELECIVADLGEFVILWKFNKTVVLFASYLRISRDEKYSIKNNNPTMLVIKDISSEYVGDYSCQISSNPPQEITYTLKFLSAPHIRTVPESRNITVNRNEKLTLKCEVQSQEYSKIEWKIKLDNSESWERSDIMGPEYVINKANPEGSGIYECVANNQIGENSAKFNVKVVYPPEFVGEKDQYSLIHGPLGMTINLTCSVNSNPNPSIVWRKNNEFIREDKFPKSSLLYNSTLTMTIKNDDYTNYTCFANNSVGSAIYTFEVTNRPSRAEFTSDPISSSETSYTLSWKVSSQRPITSYVLRLRSLLTDIVSDVPNEWKNIEVTPINEENLPNGVDRQIIRTQSYNIENLEALKAYEVYLIAANDYGSTRSGIFTFYTSDSANRAAKSYQNLFILLIIGFLMRLCFRI